MAAVIGSPSCNVTFENSILRFAAVLVAGLLGGELAARVRLPRVTGWISAGIALRLIGLPGLESGDFREVFGPFVDFVLGYIAFSVGSALHIASLKNAGKRLTFLIATEATLTPALVAGGLMLVGDQPAGVSWILGAVAIAAAPGTTMVVVKEARARGVFVKTLIAAVALIDMTAVCVFAVVAALLRADQSLSPGTVTVALGTAGRELGTAILLGLTSATLLLVWIRRLRPNVTGPGFVAVILVSWGVATALGVSAILACTCAGLFLSNMRHDTARAGQAYLIPFGEALFTVFYTVAGMQLDFGHVIGAAGLVGLFFLGRLVGKMLSSFVAMSAAGMLPEVRRYLGLALLPHGGVAIGLIVIVQETPGLSWMSDTVTTVGLAALAINQLVGPSMTRLALKRVGEIDLDRPRLLDFITEQTIIVGLQGQDKRAVIEQLVRRLFASSELGADIEQLREDLLRQAEKDSSFVGPGLVITHAVMEGDGPVRGVLGLSSKGLEFAAPDERRVHAVLLLVIPATEEAHYLEIVAAFSAGIVSNPAMRYQLYQAPSAAHAHKVLNPRGDIDFNCFLDETLIASSPPPPPQGNATSSP